MVMNPILDETPTLEEKRERFPLIRWDLVDDVLYAPTKEIASSLFVAGVEKLMIQYPYYSQPDPVDVARIIKGHKPVKTPTNELVVIGTVRVILRHGACLTSDVVLSPAMRDFFNTYQAAITSFVHAPEVDDDE